MADIVLSPVIGRLVELLFAEAKLLSGVHQRATILQGELDIIQSLLKDNANAWSDKGEMSNTLKVLVTQLSAVAERIEDVLDEYARHVKPYHGHRSNGLLRFCLCNVRFSAISLKPRYDIASEIENINESLTAIKSYCQSFGLRPLEGSSSQTTNVERRYVTLLRDHDPFIEEDELVGIDSPMEELKIKLLGGQSVRSVISLVGEGGIGKSTLARKVYKDVTVKQHFDCHAWITVSQSYNEKTLLENIRKQILSKEKSSTEDCDTQDGLIVALRQFLQTKRYIVVLDDVWQKDFWNVIKGALPINQRGSRIIITTRNSNVAACCKETPFDIVQEVQALSPDLSLELFYKKAFRYGGYHPELEKWSRMIVNKCHGLPLIISVVAGLLSTKEKNEYEWRSVLNNLSSVLEEECVSKILLLSFLDLPSSLKNCLLYLAMFPEDSEICDYDLYGLWIAEGFVEARRNMTLLQVAETYLEELIHRNIVQCEYFYGVEKFIRVHDVMHEMIVAKADEFRVCQIFSAKNESTFERKSRRLSIHGSVTKFLETIKDSAVRSVSYVSGADDELNESSLVTLFGKFKMLKVLYLASSTTLYRLPKEVGTLFHLRLLNLGGTMVEVLPTSIGELHNLQSLDLSFSSVKMLPESIGKLHNLQSLDLEGTFIRELPIAINKLRKLQFLFASHSTNLVLGIKTWRGVKIHEGIGNLENLHTLGVVEAHPRKVGILEEIQKLRKLSTLYITNLTANIHGRALCSFIEKMEKLKKLGLEASSENEFLVVHYISSPHFLDLQALTLSGRLERLPNWIMKLQNLRGLELSFSRLRNDPLVSLRDLPNLVFLVLDQAYDGEELHFEEGRFSKLKELHLIKLEGFRVLKIDKGSLLRLEDFKIGECKQLKEVTTGIQSLGKLKDLTIYGMPVEFTAMIRGYFQDLKNAPYVNVCHDTDSDVSESEDLPADQ
ncbi:hypothetical protein TIFTF001_023452 [Ficus carica]|uniref:Uncharacterized protein n=1 Tax=Ficus carica TaxID=3494 RepID=A0AA88ALS1_FICCA|nr:hypothetical protein TIFTF001_023452 [Ficus carica]